MSMTTQTLDYNNREYKSPAQCTPPGENDSSEELVDPPPRRGLGIDQGLITEIESYQAAGLMLDFETEYAEFLSSDLPKCPPEDSNENDSNTRRSSYAGHENNSSSNTGSRRRSSGATNSRSSTDGAKSSSSSGGIRYNFDGTISCCDISYDLLVGILASFGTYMYCRKKTGKLISSIDFFCIVK